VARFPRLVLMTLVILVGGPLSVLGCVIVHRAHRQFADVKTAKRPSEYRGDTRAPAKEAVSAPTEQNWRHDTSTERKVSAPARADKGDAATWISASGTLRRAPKSRSVLLSLLSHALAQSAGQNDEFDSGDTPDLVDDDCPQGYGAIAFPGLSLPALAAPDLAPNLWGIQPSIGHPHGDDEPPRV
jgi:hypothetical protein